MTSVKEIAVETPPGTDELGRGRFHFSDAYSVFDWGRMPDAIPRKGPSLCTMGAYTFECLETAGVPTHYRGVVPDGADDPAPVGDCRAPPRVMAIDLANVPALPRGDAGYEYDAYHAAAGEAYVVPLEVVFRNRVPIGSSLRRRTEPQAVGLDRSTWPDEPVDLPEPVVEFSTKYERSDRYLTREEATTIAGRADLSAIESLAHAVNETVTAQAEAAGLRHDDGKIEVVYHAGDHLVADVTGTFDENRFSHDGRQVSKEVLRQFYRRFDPDWVEALEAAKESAKAAGTADWKRRCEASPTPLPSTMVDLAGAMYAAGADAYTGLDLFDADPLADVLDRIDALSR